MGRFLTKSVWLIGLYLPVFACSDNDDGKSQFLMPDVGSRILSDASVGDAAIIPAEVDFSTFDRSDSGAADGAVGQDAGLGDACSSSNRITPDCLDPTEEREAGLCDGYDNDCDGVVDEGCGCKPGRVSSCFLGPPNQANVGACQMGTMRCVGDGEFGVFAACEGVGPTTEICDGLDNNCDGCVDESISCELAGECPSPGDPRIPIGRPFEPYPLNGPLFYEGEALSWQWSVEGGPCDRYAGTNTGFELRNANQATATLIPRLSGSYRVTLTVETPDGAFECSWVVDVLGPGLRIEMCYPESNTQDLDLYMMPVSLAEDWFPPAAMGFGGISLGGVSYNACSWYNCEAELRNFDLNTLMGLRVDWGHQNSPLSACENGPQGPQWRSLGFCANPRLDIDNNLSEGTGLPENINLDEPTNGEGYRIMVQNFSGLISRPIVNVYCGGRLKATYGAPPDVVPGFQGRRGDSGIGAMWRVAEVFPAVDVNGQTIDCEVEGIHPPGQNSGFYITQDDPTF